MMTTAIVLIYADWLEKTPQRRHKIRGRASFAFSVVRRILAEPPFTHIHDQGLFGLFDDAESASVIRLIDQIKRTRLQCQ